MRCTARQELLATKVFCPHPCHAGHGILPQKARHASCLAACASATTGARNSLSSQAMDGDVTLRIADDHPALPGHFPGDPVVPGALLLAETVTAVQHQLGTRIREVLFAKFPTVLRPALPCAVRVIERKDGSMRLVCRAGEQTYLTAVVTQTRERGQRESWSPQARVREQSRSQPAAELPSLEISALLPHGGDMVLIDRVEGWSEDDIVCSTNRHRSRQNPLRHSDSLPAFAALEYGAQAMALHGALSSGGVVRPGLLASVRDMRLFTDRLDDVSGVLWIQAVLLRRDPRAAVYTFHVGSADEVLVSGRVGVVMPAS